MIYRDLVHAEIVHCAPYVSRASRHVTRSTVGIRQCRRRRGHVTRIRIVGVGLSLWIEEHLAQKASAKNVSGRVGGWEGEVGYRVVSVVGRG